MNELISHIELVRLCLSDLETNGQKLKANEVTQCISRSILCLNEWEAREWRRVLKRLASNMNKKLLDEDIDQYLQLQLNYQDVIRHRMSRILETANNGHFGKHEPIHELSIFMNKVQVECKNFWLCTYIPDGQVACPEKEVDRMLNLCNGGNKFEDLVVASFRNGHVTFPWKRYFLQDTMKEKFLKLKEFRCEERISTEKRQLSNLRYFSRGFFPFTFKGSYLLFISTLADYELDAITDCFTEEQRMKAFRCDYKPCVLERWTKQDDFVAKIVEHVVHKGIVISESNNPPSRALTTYNLREAMWHTKVKECTQFKITLALSVYQYFGAKRVLDISAGWGVSLLHLLAN